MAKKDQESQEKQVLTEWQKRNLEFLRKKETEDSESRPSSGRSFRRYDRSSGFTVPFHPHRFGGRVARAADGAHARCG